VKFVKETSEGLRTATAYAGGEGNGDG
jgi:hypothetical protein